MLRWRLEWDGQTARMEKARKCTELQDNVSGEKNCLINISSGKGKRKVVPAHAMNTYAGSRGITPLILNLDSRWRWVVVLTLRPLYPRYSLNRKPLEPRSKSGCFRERKKLYSRRDNKSGVWFPVGAVEFPYLKKNQSFWIFDQQHRSMKCSIISNHICQCNLFSTILQQS